MGLYLVRSWARAISGRLAPPQSPSDSFHAVWEALLWSVPVVEFGLNSKIPGVGCWKAGGTRGAAPHSRGWGNGCVLLTHLLEIQSGMQVVLYGPHDHQTRRFPRPVTIPKTTQQDGGKWWPKKGSRILMNVANQTCSCCLPKCLFVKKQKRPRQLPLSGYPAVTSLGHYGQQRVFWEEPKICNCVQ